MQKRQKGQKPGQRKTGNNPLIPEIKKRRLR